MTDTCSACNGDVWIEVSAGPPGPPELRLCTLCQPDAATVNARLTELATSQRTGYHVGYTKGMADGEAEGWTNGTRNAAQIVRNLKRQPEIIKGRLAQALLEDAAKAVEKALAMDDEAAVAESDGWRLFRLCEQMILACKCTDDHDYAPACASCAVWIAVFKESPQLTMSRMVFASKPEDEPSG